MMKKLVLISVLLTLTIGYTFIFCRQKTIIPEKAIGQTVLDQVDSFSTLISKLQHVLINRNPSASELQKLFLETRIAYKKFEWAAEYFVPETSKRVNGPPVQEVELPDTTVIEPTGLQVIEGYLFPNYDSAKTKLLIDQLSLLQGDCENYKSFFKTNQFYDWQIFDAVRLEVFRIITLGITGFDNPLTLKSIQESASSFESLQKVTNYFADKKYGDSLVLKFDKAVVYLKGNSNFNSFNRMEFITTYCNPITIGISGLKEERKDHGFKHNILLNQDAKTLFDTNAFNINAYAPDHSSFITPEKVILGKKLFSDPILSGNGNRSCQSCHQPEKAFTDGLIKNTVIGKTEQLGRNTPSLINAALQPSLFYDMRVNSLEDQSHSVVQSDKEMHGSISVSVKRLWQDKEYRKMFLIAFPNEDENGIDTFEVMNAIGSYIRSLVLLNSRFDEYMRGDKNAMNVNEINGFNLFMGKAKCATCHFMPLFNGNFPPGYKQMESEIIGVPETRANLHIDPDLGRYDIIKIESFKHAFKIPTIRNTTLTAPYMHNGVFSTLDQVLEFYNRGGGAGSGIKIENQTLPVDSLNLTVKERGDIIAFINCLDSKLTAE
jgi:cytochrome c peroxidase